MKMFYKLLITGSLFIIILSSSQCKRKANEVGRNSIFFYMDGEEVKSSCSSLIDVTEAPDTLNIRMCVDNTYLFFDVNNYHGEATYLFDAASGNACHTDIYANPVYQAADNRKTYLQILEIDHFNRIIRGLFEAELINTDNPNDVKLLTKGRFDLDY